MSLDAQHALALDVQIACLETSVHGAIYVSTFRTA